MHQFIFLSILISYAKPWASALLIIHVFVICFLWYMIIHKDFTLAIKVSSLVGQYL
jgi:hypothetical protein